MNYTLQRLFRGHFEAPEVELMMGLQVCEHLQRVAKLLGVWVAPIVGGISPAKQARLLGRQPQVLFFLFPTKLCLAQAAATSPLLPRMHHLTPSRMDIRAGS